MGGNRRPKPCRPRVSKNPQLQHDTAEKKEEIISKLETTRHERAVKRMREELESFIEETPEQKRKRSKPEKKTNMKSGPRLKGAARPASIVAIYQPWVVPPLPPSNPTTNLFETQTGKFWDHAKTREFLVNLHELAKAYHKHYLEYESTHPNDEKETKAPQNTKRKNGQKRRTLEEVKRPKTPIRIYHEILKLDPTDHLNARHGLLQFYLHTNVPEKARSLLNQFPDDRSACFCYSRVLIEYVSWCLLNEKDGSEDNAIAMLQTAVERNPFVAWIISYPKTFIAAIECLDEINKNPLPGTIEEALIYCTSDLELWTGTEDANLWIRSYITHSSQSIPRSIPCDGGNEKKKPKNQKVLFHNFIFAQMFNTGMEMIESNCLDSDNEIQEN